MLKWVATILRTQPIEQWSGVYTSLHVHSKYNGMDRARIWLAHRIRLIHVSPSQQEQLDHMGLNWTHSWTFHARNNSKERAVSLQKAKRWHGILEGMLSLPSHHDTCITCRPTYYD